MATLEIGRVVMKVAGRESGKIATVVKKINDSFVIITGPKLLTGVKRRRANVEHLEPTPYTIEAKEDASDEEIIEAYKKANLITKFNLKLPSAAQLKAEKDKPEKSKEKPEDKTKKEKEDSK